MPVAGIHSIATANLTSIENATNRPDWWDTQLADVNGQMRDRPVFRAHRPEANWKTLDFRDRYANVKAAGFDVIYLDLLFGLTHPADALLAYDGADMAGMKIIAQPDVNSWNGNMTSANGFPTEASIVTECVRRLKLLLVKPAAYQMADGRYVVSPYHAELWTASRWLAVMNQLESDMGITTAFIANFASFSVMSAYKTTMGTKMIACGIWGDRDPADASVVNSITNNNNAHAIGLQFCQFTSNQDVRPREFLYYESKNSGAMRATWAQAINGHAEWTLHTTLDDYFEGAFLEPSANRGPGWLWLCSYYVHWYKTGVQPTVAKDTLFVSNRRTPFGATPTAQTAATMALRSGGSAASNNVECVAFLTSPGIVTLDGTPTSCPAGLTVLTVPLTARQHTATLTRSGVVTLTVNSTVASVAALPSQQLDYVMATNATDASFHTSEAVITSWKQTNAEGTNASSVTVGSGGATDGSVPYDTANIGATGVMIYDNTHTVFGTGEAIKFSSGASAASIYAGWTSSISYATPMYGSACFYFTANPAAQLRLITVLNGSAAAIMSINLLTSGALQAFAGGSAANTTATIPLNTWFRVEWQLITTSATVGQIEVRLFPTATSTTATETKTSPATYNTGTVDPAEVRLGPSAAVANIVAFWAGYLQASNTGYPAAPVSLTNVVATRATTWNLKATTAQTRATTWNVKATVAQTRATTWNELQNLLTTRATSWNTRKSVAQTRATTWNALAKIASAATRATTWNVAFTAGSTKVTAQRPTTWNVLLPHFFFINSSGVAMPAEMYYLNPSGTWVPAVRQLQ